MQTYAITPAVPGQPVSSRAIKPDWALSEGETFKVTLEQPDTPDNYVLDDAGLQLRLRDANDEKVLAQSAKLAALKTLANRIKFSEFSHNDTWWDCDSAGQAAIVGQVVELIVAPSPPAEILWKSADNAWVNVGDSTAFRVLASALGKHYRDVLTRKTALEGDIAKAPDPAAVDITTGWPTTRVDLTEFK